MSAVLSRSGSAPDLVRLGFEGQVTLVISAFVVVEVERNVERKAEARLPRLRQILDDCPFAVALPSAEVIASEAARVEPKDAAIVATVAGNAQFLATYDAKHLLSQAALIEARHGIVVCPPAVVLADMTNA